MLTTLIQFSVLQSTRRRLRNADTLAKLALAVLTVVLLSGCAVVTPNNEAANMLDGDEDATVVEGDALAVEPAAPLAAVDALAPAALAIPAAAVDAAVEPMEWRIVGTGDDRTTEWIVPEAGVGWHTNSAAAGAAGNTIVSGNQQLGDAAFAPIALGDVEPGQQVVVTDEQGRAFVYHIREISEPIPLSGATDEETKQVERYMTGTAMGSESDENGTDVETDAASDASEESSVGASTADESTSQMVNEPMGAATLTLITGWPDFTTTHRIFVVAELEGLLQ